MNTNGIPTVARSNTKVLIAGSLVVIAGVWIGVAVFNRKRTLRDQKAVAFFSELQRDIAPDTVGIEESSAFNIDYWRNKSKQLKKPVYMLTAASAKAFAQDIKDSWSAWGDNEDKIKGVFRALKDYIQVSQLADYYYHLDPKNKINLIDDLKSRLSKAELGEVLAIVKKMPPFRLAETPKKQK